MLAAACATLWQACQVANEFELKNFHFSQDLCNNSFFVYIFYYFCQPFFFHTYFCARYVFSPHAFHFFSYKSKYFRCNLFFNSIPYFSYSSSYQHCFAIETSFYMNFHFYFVNPMPTIQCVLSAGKKLCQSVKFKCGHTDMYTDLCPCMFIYLGKFLSHCFFFSSLPNIFL